MLGDVVQSEVERRRMRACIVQVQDLTENVCTAEVKAGVEGFDQKDPRWARNPFE